MQNPTDKLVGIPAKSQNWFSPTGTLPVLCSGLAVAILAFLIPYALITKCSIANVAFFVAMFIISGMLSVTGAFLLVLGRIRPGNKYAILNVLLLLLYIALLLFLWQLMYS